MNSERYLAEAIESVLAQTYPQVEYVIVDGGSTDATLDVIRRYEERFEGRLRWISEPDSGVYDAMNKGIALCHGELIGLLNSDDRYPPDAIETVVDAAVADSDVGLIYGDVDVISEDGSLLATQTATDVGPGDRPDWMPMCHQSLFVRADVYRELGAYDVSYEVLADYEFVLRCLAAGVRSFRLDKVLAEFRIGGLCNTETVRSNRERERIRVAYGANPVWERVRYLRHRVNLWLFASYKRLFGREPRPDAIARHPH